MPSTVEQLSPTRVKITVEVPFADLKPSMDKAYAEIAKSVNIPGFRRGKVPPMVIDQRFGRGVVIQEAFNDVWQASTARLSSRTSCRPLAQPELEVTKLEDGDLIEFTAEVDVRPDFELPDFASLEARSTRWMCRRRWSTSRSTCCATASAPARPSSARRPTATS